MSPRTSMIILHAQPPGSIRRSYQCSSALELSGAAAQEMLRATDPRVILTWLSGENFHQFWTSHFSSPNAPSSEVTMPGDCWYLDALTGDRLPTQLTIEAGP